MAAPSQPYPSFDEYSIRERQAEPRSEYVNGELPLADIYVKPNLLRGQP